MPKRLEWARDLFGAVAAGMLLAFIGPFHPPDAFAATCTQGLNNNTFAIQPYDSVDGVRVGVSGQGIAVHSNSPSCPQVRSVWVYFSSTQFAEVGYDINPAGANPTLTKCSTSSTPHLMIYMVTGGTTKCKTGTPAVSGWIEVQVKYKPVDGYWHYEYNGVDQGFFSGAFTGGQDGSLTERHNSSDGMQAHFDGLQYSPNGSASWYAMGTNLWSPGGDVTGWHFCASYNGHGDDYAVLPTGTAC